MSEIEAMIVILEKEITTQQAKMVVSQTRLDTEKLDALTMAKFQLEEFIRLSRAS